VIEEGQTAFQKRVTDEFQQPNQMTVSPNYHLAFQVKTIKQNNMVGLTVGGTIPYDFDVRPSNSNATQKISNNLDLLNKPDDD
jgi:hypothetical protein